MVSMVVSSTDVSVRVQNGTAAVSLQKYIYILKEITHYLLTVVSECDEAYRDNGIVS